MRRDRHLPSGRRMPYGIADQVQTESAASGSRCPGSSNPLRPGTPAQHPPVRRWAAQTPRHCARRRTDPPEADASLPPPCRLSTLFTVADSSRIPARRCDTHSPVCSRSSASNPANSSMLANGFLISCARIAETSASASALRAASRSCSASLFAVISRRIQMLCSALLAHAGNRPQRSHRRAFAC